MNEESEKQQDTDNHLLGKLSIGNVSNSTLFSVTKRYTITNPNDKYEVDKRFVQLEIETEKPLSDEFYDALTNLLSAYCG